MKSGLRSMGKILVAMYGLTAVLLGLLAMAVQKSGGGTKFISIGICIVYVVVCCLGGFLLGKLQKSRKFLWGLLAGGCYALGVLILTICIKHGVEGVFFSILLNFFLCLAAGMAGGMVS